MAMEGGFTQSYEDLVLNAQQWLERSLGGVKAVVIVKIHEEPVSGDKDPIVVTRQRVLIQMSLLCHCLDEKKSLCNLALTPWGRFLRCAVIIVIQRPSVHNLMVTEFYIATPPLVPFK